ncbi:MAG: bifunctional diaminohydroxyphosphoribosylaminopyrimidine deaminase/5-amino-6-(5-phosphoribosylamino)uracil reductase RibD [Helicobacteraceae bacterium]|nr:bifunctional diaminohydroxyphosphoribosylaminopyrimidine deaminase/5-amino-6-(5-phosphoribosylamino)uracil reductase RibD [Helicobacteraceae bacterium]
MVEYEFYMNLALDYAWESQALALPNPSVGALILDRFNSIVALKSHTQFGDCHAELLACKEAYKTLSKDNRIDKLKQPQEIYEFLVKNHNGIFRDTSIFVTLEPCSHYGKTPSCASLLSILKPKRVIISSLESNKIASGGIEVLQKSGIRVVSKILENRGRDLLFPFLCMQKKGSFCIYKIAQNLNGSFEGGIISSLDSRIYSHKLRNIANRIIISQKTLLNDNSLLDSRLINGKAPDVCVLGRENRITKDLKVFSIPNRKVSFFESVEQIPKNGFSIVEGGAEMFESFENIVDCNLFFIAPRISSGKSLKTDFSGRILHNTKSGEDILLWIQKD